MSDEKSRAMWEAAQAYNKKLLAKSGDRFVLTDEEKEAYNKVLDVTGTGIMGYVNIPRIAVSLPIYHGTDPAVLEIAVGHIEGSSLPVGGKGTHCVISGHRGLPSAKLFTDIDRLKEGDTFQLQVCDRSGQRLLYARDLHALRCQYAPPAGSGTPDQGRADRSDGKRGRRPD